MARCLSPLVPAGARQGQAESGGIPSRRVVIPSLQSLSCDIHRRAPLQVCEILSPTHFEALFSYIMQEIYTCVLGLSPCEAESL